MKQLYLLLLAMMPINELRGTIPVGIEVFKLPVWQVLLVAITGTMIPIFFLLLLLPWLVNFLTKRSALADRFFTWLFQRTREKFYKNYSLYGNLGLAIFVAIPLPMTGAWSGAVAAFVFGIPYWRALGWIFLGVVVSGLIIMVLSLGLFSII